MLKTSRSLGGSMMLLFCRSLTVGTWELGGGRLKRYTGLIAMIHGLLFDLPWRDMLRLVRMFGKGWSNVRMN